MKRYCLVTLRNRPDELNVIQAYLPNNYKIESVTSYGVVVGGRDNHGWTLHQYVIPRLGSALYAAREIDLSHACMGEIND